MICHPPALQLEPSRQATGITITPVGPAVEARGTVTDTRGKERRRLTKKSSEFRLYFGQQCCSVLSIIETPLKKTRSSTVVRSKVEIVLLRVIHHRNSIEENCTE